MRLWGDDIVLCVWERCGGGGDDRGGGIAGDKVDRGERTG